MSSYLDFSRLGVGEDLPPLTKKPISKTQLVRYAGASGDFNPLHTDDATAQKSGLKGVIAQGILIMGFVGQAITQWAPRRHLKKFKVRLTGMTFPGDTITVKATVTEKSEQDNKLRVLCDTTAVDQNDDVKISGQFELSLPVTKP